MMISPFYREPRKQIVFMHHARIDFGEIDLRRPNSPKSALRNTSQPPLGQTHVFVPLGTQENSPPFLTVSIEDGETRKSR